MEKDKTLIVYHREDNDGIFSAAIAHRYLVDTIHIDPDKIDTFGCSYVELMDKWENGEVKEWPKIYERIIMTDMSFGDVKIMKWIYNNFENRFVWIDHHAPIINECIKEGIEDKIQGIRDTKRSALLNMYRYFYDPLDGKYNSGKACPLLFRILSAWDSFTFEQEGFDLIYTRKVNLGANFKWKVSLETLLNDPEWEGLMEFNGCAYTIHNNLLVDELYEVGNIIFENDMSNYKKMVDEEGDMTWTVNGRPACALFVQGASTGLMFDSVKNNVDNGIVFKRNRNTTWTMSVYNTKYEDTFNCGNYLKQTYGGGGHVGAAGCTLTEEKFLEILKTKQV